MKILYVRRNDSLDTWFKRPFKEFRRTLYFGDQDGFFEQSLFTVADVTEVTVADLPKALDSIHLYDALVVNSKCNRFPTRADLEEFLRTTCINVNIPKALFIGAAQAEWMVEDSVADAFDVIFKREPFRDRDRYNLSSQNKKKIVATMISCPFAPHPRNTIQSKIFHLFRHDISPCMHSDTQFEVGFAGALSGDHTIRADAWGRVVTAGFSTIGGLQYHPRHGKRPDIALVGPRLTGSAYRNVMCDAKVNLALDGIGEFTFRHLELWYLGAFMLSSPSIRTVELPINAVEGEHYIAYDNLDDLESKVRYYVAHDPERNRIAENGRALFEKEYDPVRHGTELIAHLR